MRIEDTPGGRLAAARLADAYGNVDSALQAVGSPYRLRDFYDYVDAAAVGLRRDFSIGRADDIALAGRLAGVAAAAYLLGVETARAEGAEASSEPRGPRCAECGDPIAVWHHFLLCDRCLDARRARDLDRDDYVLVRRLPSGRVLLQSKYGGNRRGTDLTALHVDVPTETGLRIRKMIAATNPTPPRLAIRVDANTYGICKRCHGPRASAYRTEGTLNGIHVTATRGIVCPNADCRDLYDGPTIYGNPHPAETPTKPRENSDE